MSTIWLDARSDVIEQGTQVGNEQGNSHHDDDQGNLRPVLDGSCAMVVADRGL